MTEQTRRNRMLVNPDFRAFLDSLVKSLVKKYEAGEPETVAYLEGEYNRLMSLSPDTSDVYPSGSQWA